MDEHYVEQKKPETSEYVLYEYILYDYKVLEQVKVEIWMVVSWGAGDTGIDWEGYKGLLKGDGNLYANWSGGYTGVNLSKSINMNT